MTIQFRNYNGQADYTRISDFLIAHHQPNNADGNWLEPAWEYMHNHPYLDQSSRGRNGIWEEDGAISFSIQLRRNSGAKLVSIFHICTARSKSLWR